MNDYIKSIQDLPSDAQTRITKDLNTYVSSYVKKQDFKACHSRYVKYFEQGKKLSFSFQQFDSAFKAKDFFKDLDDCGSWLNFRIYTEHNNKTKLHKGNFCKRDKLCLACAIRRANKQQKKFMTIVEQLPDLLDRDWYYIVIPVRHTKKDSFEKVFGHIEQIKKKISMQMRNGRRGKSSGFFSSFAGGMFAIEITYKNGWNVHMNLLLNAPKGTHLGVLKKHTQVYEGRKKTTLSSPDLSDWLRQFNNSHINSVNKLDFSTKEDIKGNLIEILKYSLKFASLSNLQLMEVFVKTRKKRLFGTFGNLWGKGLETVDLDNEEELTGEFIDLILYRAFDYGDVPNYRLYKREIMKEEKKEAAELVHTFGIVIPKIAEHKKYYNSAPMIMINQGNGRFSIKAKC